MPSHTRQTIATHLAISSTSLREMQGDPRGCRVWQLAAGVEKHVAIRIVTDRPSALFHILRWANRVRCQLTPSVRDVPSVKYLRGACRKGFALHVSSGSINVGSTALFLCRELTARVPQLRVASIVFNMTAASGVFFAKIHPPLLAILIVLLWFVIAMRVQRIRTMDYPSRWWMVSVSCIITAGVLCTAYLALWIGITVVNLRLHRLAHKYGIPSEAVPDQLLPDGKFLTPSIFTSDELAYMGYHQNVLFDVGDLRRTDLSRRLDRC